MRTSFIIKLISVLAIAAGLSACCCTTGTTGEGRAAIQPIEMRSVYFGFDSAELTAKAKNAINQNWEMIQELQPSRVQLDGQTDPRGEMAYNKQLGLKRAEAVKNELVSLGLNEDRVIVGSSTRELSSTIASPESWAQDRGVHFSIAE